MNSANTTALLRTSLHEKQNPAQPFRFGDLLPIAMHVVELIQRKMSDNQKMTGDEKRALAKELMFDLIDVAQVDGYLTQVQANEMQSMVRVSATILDGLIDAFHFIREHPTYIQITEHIKTRCCAGSRQRKH